MLVSDSIAVTCYPLCCLISPHRHGRLRYGDTHDPAVHPRFSLAVHAGFPLHSNKHVAESVLCTFATGLLILQVNAMSGGHVPVVPSQAKPVTQVPESALFSLFSHFPVSNGGGSCSGMGGLQGMTHEQSSTTGYQLFGSSGVTFPSVSPLLPVSLY